MRHKVYGRKLSRNKNERTALFRNLVRSLLLSQKIQTTEAKAKAIKGLVDKIITQAKTPSTRRLVSQFLVEKELQEKLVNELLPRLGGRNSGYTSTVRLGKRMGDGAMMVQMNLLVEEKKAAKSETVKEVKTETKEATASKVEAKTEKKTTKPAAKKTVKKEAK